MGDLSRWYTTQNANGSLNFDPAQAQLITELDQFLIKFARLNFITRYWNREDKLGYYIYGGVGQGKTMIMDSMYQFTHTHRKTRLHFHEFIYKVQQYLGLKSTNSIELLARQLKKRYDIIYLDELHINDIATAMILQRLFHNLFIYKIYIISSSNYHPDQLWPDGLMRERFLPAITLIKQRLNLINLAAQQDYRLLHDANLKLFYIKPTAIDSKIADKLAYQALDKIFTQINAQQAMEPNTSIEICKRLIPCLKRGVKICWFDFAVICGEQRSQLDYLELAKKYQWLIISNIFPLDFEKKDLARRFTWLIDVLYDHHSKLALSSSVLLKDIYPSGDLKNEFTRTLSRLQEMQTQTYLEKNLTLSNFETYNSDLDNKVNWHKRGVAQSG
jgi:cell division protein ZapE